MILLRAGAGRVALIALTFSLLTKSDQPVLSLHGMLNIVVSPKSTQLKKINSSLPKIVSATAFGPTFLKKEYTMELEFHHQIHQKRQKLPGIHVGKKINYNSRLSLNAPSRNN